MKLSIRIVKQPFQALNSPVTMSRMVWECRQRRVPHWMSEHIGAEENEKVDELAMKLPETSLPPLTSTPLVGRESLFATFEMPSSKGGTQNINSKQGGTSKGSERTYWTGLTKTRL